MTGIGLFLLYLGYALAYWGLQAIQGNPQDSFVTYLFPKAPNTGTGGTGTRSAQTTGSGSPSATKAAAKPITSRTASDVNNKIAGQGL